MTDAEVKINGQSAGEVHQGAFYAFKYEITKLLKLGEKNLLEVTVSKHSANESVNNAERRADFWIFGGIFRPVWLEVLPAITIDKIFINAKASGGFEANVTAGDKDDDLFKMSVSIFNPKNVLVKKIIIDNPDDNDHSRYIVKDKIVNPELWTSETPNLYKAVFEIYKGNHSYCNSKIWIQNSRSKDKEMVYM
jgi:beta-galactosidase/beta-glucuronidase